MDKISKLILCWIPNKACNLKCGYCYITQSDRWGDNSKGKLNPSLIVRSLSKERLGGAALVNITADGETLIEPGIVELIYGLLLEGHYVEVVTNATLQNKIFEILKFPDNLLDHLFFKISFHYEELIRLNILDRFIDTVKHIKNSKASFTIELMANDKLDDKIDGIKELCSKEFGAVCQATIGRNNAKVGRDLLSEHSEEEFLKMWDKIESPMLKFKVEMLGKKRKEYCYAGKWSLFVNIYSGDAKACYGQPYSQNIFKNLNKKISFYPVGHYCTMPYCINAHAHLTWGLIPKLKTPTYSVMRNRVCIDGSEWLKEPFLSFSESRLLDSNSKDNFVKRVIFTVLQPFRYFIFVISKPNDAIKGIRKRIKGLSR